jgi:uncharacterized protein YdaU (DUF1376 family)
MNYYNHHIGDFRSGTIHFSKLMRWLYRDMLEAYYDKEESLPANLDDLCDMIGAHAEEERQAVQRVLKLKFELRDGRYHHQRCDEAIGAYQDSIAEEEAKRENEAERQRRHRERRAKLFQQLRDEFDDVPPYDTPIKVLEDYLKQHQQRRDFAGTFDGRTEEIHGTSQPVTRDIHAHPSDATAVTKNQEPITINQEPEKNKASEQSPDSPLDPVGKSVLGETQDAPENGGEEAPAKAGRLHSTEEDRECAQWIFNECVLKVNPAAKLKNPNAWANDIRLMREIDERTHRQICELFKWAASDPFWCANILSPGKLREQWDRLVLQRGRVRPASQVGNGAYAATMANAASAKAMIFGGEAEHAAK